MAALLTVREVADQLGVSPDFVRARIASGELRALRSLGRGYRIRESSLRSFLASRETGHLCAPEDPVASPPSRAGRRRRVARKASAQPFRSSREAIEELCSPKADA